jgi:hypothetical protein
VCVGGWKSVVGERGGAGRGRKAEERQIFKRISTHTHAHIHAKLTPSFAPL